MASLFRLPVPFPVDVSNTSSAMGTAFALNQSTDALEYVFQVPPEAHGLTLTRLFLRQGTVTGTAPTYRISLQGVTGAGIPDGSIKGSGNCFVDITPVAGGNSAGAWNTLGTSYVMTAGEMLALVITYQSGTVDGSNFCTFTPTVMTGNSQLPYAIQNDNAVRTRQTAAPVFGFGTATGAFGNPLTACTLVTWQSGTNPSEHALRFVVPSGMCSTFKMAGARIYYVGLTAGSLILRLYSGTTVLQDVSLDSDHTGSQGTLRPLDLYFDETSLTSLTAGTEYRLAVAAGAAVNDFIVHVETLTAADLDAFAMGQTWYGSTRNGAAWTDVTTRRYFLTPIFSDITGGGGGGGSRGIYTGGRL